MDSETEKPLLAVIHAANCLLERSLCSRQHQGPRTPPEDSGGSRMGLGLRSSRLPCLALALQRQQSFLDSKL